MADGDIKLKATVETTSAYKTLDSLKTKIKNTFSGKEADALDSKIIKAAESAKKLTNDLSQVKSQMEEISSGRAAPKSIISLENEIKKAEKELAKLDVQFDKFAAEQADIVDRSITIEGKQWMSPEDTARMQELDQQIIKNGQDTDVVTGKLEKMRAKLSELKVNPQLTPEFQQLSDRAAEITGKLAVTQQEMDELAGKNISDPFKNVVKSVDTVIKRIKTLAKRVLFFTVITKLLNLVKSEISLIINSNEELSNSFSQIRGNLSVTFQSLITALLPAIKAISDALVVATARLAQFVAYLTGTSIEASREAAAALREQADAAKQVGKSSLGFDELNTISSPTSDKEATKRFQTSDLTITSGIEDKMKGILTVVVAIGTALLAWKITDFISQLSKSQSMLNTILSSLKLISGAAMVIGGAILLCTQYSTAWVNGIDWSNLSLILLGIGLLIGGIALLLGSTAAACAAIGAGIALIVLGIKDFLANGPTLQNILTIIIGLMIVFAAVWLLAGAPIAAIVVGIIALIAIFVILWNKCEGFRNFWITLWEHIKQIALDVWEGFLKPIFDAIVQTISDLWNNTIKPVWEDKIKPALVAVGLKFKELWDKVIKPIFNKIGEICKWLWDKILRPMISFIKDMLIAKIKIHLDTLKNIFSSVFNAIGDIINNIKKIFSGIVDFIVGIFTGDMEKAMGGVSQAFSGWIDGIKGVFVGFVNVGISIINGFIKGINLAIGLINKIPGVELPELKEIPKIENPPALARGAVLPPNKPFMAMVGDQKHGTNIEAPLSTIEKAVENVLARKGISDGNRPINIIAKGDVADFIRFLSFELANESERTGMKLSSGGVK